MLNEFLIRLTNFCNETCDHCVFRSGPEFNTHLTEELADQINRWIPPTPANICLLGGEITLVPHYPELVRILSRGIDQVGIVTNGIFARSDKTFDRFLETIKSLSNRIVTIRLSQSQFHSTSYGQEAFDKLMQKFENSSKKRHVQLARNSTIIPFGRAYDNRVWFRSPNTLNPINIVQGAMCESQVDNIFIDEEGFIHSCPLGGARYKHVSEDSFHKIQKEVRDWQLYRMERGMTCLSCSSTGVGNHTSKLIPLRVKDTAKCAGNSFSGVL